MVLSTLRVRSLELLLCIICATVIECFSLFVLGWDFSLSIYTAMNSLLSPLSSVGWMNGAVYVTQMILLGIFGIMFIRIKFLRLMLFQVLTLIWVLFGFLCLASAY